MGPCDEEYCSSYCRVISTFMHDYPSMRRHLSGSRKFHGYQELLVHWQQCFEGVQLFTRKSWFSVQAGDGHMGDY